MRRIIILCIGVFLLIGMAAGSYWYLHLRNSEDPMPESGIFVMEDSPCKLYM